MKTKNKRFAITEKESYLILAALYLAESQLKEAENEVGLTPREKLTLAEIKTLKNRLANYKWIVEY